MLLSKVYNEAVYTFSLTARQHSIYVQCANNFYLHMNIVFASQREREMMILRKKKIKSILLYNLQEIDRKRTLKESEKNQFEHSYQSSATQALENLHQQNRRKSLKREVQKQLLRDSYQRQIRDRQQKKKMEKLRDRDYLDRQRTYFQYEQARRMADIRKMFDRVAYLGVPIKGHNRTMTEHLQENPQLTQLHLPSINQKQMKTEGNDNTCGQISERKVSLPASLTKKKIEAVPIQAIHKQHLSTPKNKS